jgi:hypothetical protein
MRLLVLYQARDATADQPGYYDGFERLTAEGQLQAHAAIPYRVVAEERGWQALWDDAESAARDADAVLLQFFHSPMPDPGERILRIRNLPNHPLIFASLGDPYGRWSHRVPRSFRVASRLAEASFLSGMGYVARQLLRSGGRNLVLMPLGCCQVRFSSAPAEPASNPEFDACFVGSRISCRNPFSHFYPVSRRRAEFVAAFTKRYGRRFGLFGHGWEGNPAWQGAVPYLSQLDVYRRSAVVLGGMPNALHDYYASDRPFIAIASGVPLLDYWVRGVDRILEPAHDWWLARDLKQMLGLCDRLLEMPSGERLRIGAAARERVLAHHTQYHRCEAMVEIMKSLLRARREGRLAPPPELNFLGRSHESESVSEAIAGWRG